MKQLALTACTLLLAGGLFAQEQEKRTIKIDVTVEENGEVKHIRKEIDLPSDARLQEVLREVEGLENIKIDGDGEELRIIVRKNGEDASYTFEMNELAENMAAMAENLKLNGKDLEHFVWNENRAFLGVSPAEVPADGGAAIGEITPGSAAEKAGLQAGDVITRINDTPVNSFEELAEAIHALSPEDEVEIRYQRNGKKEKTKATLGKHELKMSRVEMMGEPGVAMAFAGDVDPNKAFLGVTYETNETGGVELLSVVPNSTAETMGLKKGDVILKIDNEEVSSKGIRDILASKKTGDKIRVEYERNGSKETAEAELKPRPKMEMKEFALANPMKRNFRVEINICPVSEEDKDMLSKSLNLDFNKELTPDKVVLAPNPSNGAFELSFDLSTTGPLSIRVVNSSAQSVYEEEVNNFTGSYSRKININGQPGGIYYLIITQNGKPYTRMIVLQ